VRHFLQYVNYCLGTGDQVVDRDREEDITESWKVNKSESRKSKVRACDKQRGQNVCQRKRQGENIKWRIKWV
jgi:hypothetical protein